MISADDVLQILDALIVAGVTVWLDGGWAVDAVVGEQTRPHDDLDLVVALDRADAVQATLTPLGFTLVEDERPTRLVLCDASDRRIDLHTVTFDVAGDGIQILQDGSSWNYPAHGFTGVGRIAGREFPCLTIDVQILCHAGYDLDATDLHDLELLRARI